MKWDEDPAPKVMYPCGHGHGISQEPFGDGFGYKGIRTDVNNKLLPLCLHRCSVPQQHHVQGHRATRAASGDRLCAEVPSFPGQVVFIFAGRIHPWVGSCTSDAAEGTSNLSIFLLNSCGRFAASPLWGLFGEIWQGKQRVQLAPETRSLAWHGRVGL